MVAWLSGVDDVIAYLTRVSAPALPLPLISLLCVSRSSVSVSVCLFTYLCVCQFMLIHVPKANEAARLVYTSSYLEDGWDRLQVSNNENMDDAITASAAGFGEGYITAERIALHASNTGAAAVPSQKLSDFLSENDKFMAQSISAAQSLPNGDPLKQYWYHVNLVLLQLQGICAGYNASDYGKAHLMPCQNVLAINLDGDMEDLSSALDNPNPYSDDRFFKATHCSALIKVLQNNSDVFISQDTWSSFNSMMRIFKRYDLNFLRFVQFDLVNFISF